MEIPSAVTDARSNAASLGKTAADYATASYTMPEQLRKTVQEALDYNKDIIGMRSTALADYQAAPAQANAKFGVQTFGTGPQAGQANPDYIFNPFERNSAIQSFTANQSIPFNIANALFGMRQGSAADVINAGTGAFNAQAAAAQAAAQAARQTYQDVLNEFQVTTQLQQEQQKINKSGASENYLKDLIQQLQQLKGDQQNGTGEIVPPQDPGAAFIEPDVVVKNTNQRTTGGIIPSIPVNTQSAIMNLTKPKSSQQTIEQRLKSINLKKGTLPSNNIPLNL